MSPRPPQRRRKSAVRRSPGQIVVIFGLVLTVLMLFVGLALDAGSLYISYAHLKRAVDAAAVAAANQFKRNDATESYEDRVKHIKSAARETMALQGIDIASDTVHIRVFICDEDGDGYRDAYLNNSSSQFYNPQFYNTCPATDPATATAPLARKLAWVQATQYAPLYFLQLIGIKSVPLTTNSIGEAAPLDLLIVLDTSMSMGRDTPGFSSNNYNPNASPPTGCNADDSCQPLKDTKTAAMGLADTLFEGYDRAAVITFDLYARSVSSNFQTSKTAIDADIASVKLHADAPISKIWGPWWSSNSAYTVLFNPANPEDWDGDGSDGDIFNGANPGLGYSSDCPDILDSTESGTNTTFDVYKNRWWNGSVNPLPYDPPASWMGLYGGAPCDRGTKYDAFNWTDSSTGYDSNDTTGTDITIRNWMTNDQAALGHYLYPNVASPPAVSASDIASGTAHDRAARLLSTVTTCTGCGIRVASDFFRQYGRRNAVWVMVFLSDGIANASDTPGENPTFYYDPAPTLANPTPTFTWNIGQYFQNGVCAGTPGHPLWLSSDGNDYLCVDQNPPKSASDTTNPRYCVDEIKTNASGTAIDTCPPGSTKLANPDTNLADMTNRVKYGPYQYAMDMIDSATLTVNSTSDSSKASLYNPIEPKGNTIAVYTIAFGSGATRTVYGTTMGVNLLRYMAAVGDDGDRVTDPCASVSDPTQQCGNYYYAPDATGLIGVFEDIAKRIQTRISF